MQTYSANPVETEAIRRDDESEARLLDAEGLGEVIEIDDDEIRRYSMVDFGFGRDT